MEAAAGEVYQAIGMLAVVYVYLRMFGWAWRQL